MTLPRNLRVESKHLLIRPVEDGDLSALLQVNGDDAVTQFLPYETWKSPADGRAWLHKMRAVEDEGTGVQLVVVDKATAQVMGACLLFRYEAGSARAELGYVLGRRHWHKGVMHEALVTLLAHAFATVGLRRIEAQVHPDNAPSSQLLVRLGFIKEGVLRKRWVSKGQTYDIDFYGLLREEWSGADRGVRHASPDSG